MLHFKGLHERAIEDYDKVLAAQPDANVTLFRGLSYLAKGDETRGFADLEKGIGLAPDDHWYRYRRGLEYAKRGQADAAIADLDKAIALKSDDRSSYLLRAELHTKKGDIGEGHRRPDAGYSKLTPSLPFIFIPIARFSTSRPANTIGLSPTMTSCSF